MFFQVNSARCKIPPVFIPPNFCRRREQQQTTSFSEIMTKQLKDFFSLLSRMYNSENLTDAIEISRLDSLMIKFNKLSSVRKLLLPSCHRPPACLEFKTSTYIRKVGAFQMRSAINEFKSWAGLLRVFFAAVSLRPERLTAFETLLSSERRFATSICKVE